MLHKGLTLRGLEVFEALAKSGSVAGAAQLTGLSPPAISQQIRNLENTLGTELLDRSHRPLRLTPAGQGFAGRVQTILSELRLAHNELAVMDLSHLRTLRLGIIDDFDNDVTPELVGELAETLTHCHFRLISAPSHEITAAIGGRDLDIAVCAVPKEMPAGVVEYPLVREPFIATAPKGVQADPEALKALPLLRYERTQLIARTIETGLANIPHSFAGRCELGSHQALMALVAQGAGWAITTPLGLMRAARFHEDLRAHPLCFPELGPDFGRRISLFAADDWAERVPTDIARVLRRLIHRHAIAPAHERWPWMHPGLGLISPDSHQ